MEYLMLFESKIKEIEEALSFNKTFKAPDENDKALREEEALNEFLNSLKKSKLPDGTWHVHANVYTSFLESPLKSLKQLNISKVDGDFNCESKNLKSLEGCPTVVKGWFDCSFNKLTTLEGCPTVLGGSLICVGCGLKSLKGCPSKINGNMSCYANKLSSLEGLPKEIKSYLSIEDNDKKFTVKQIRAVCKVGEEIFV